MTRLMILIDEPERSALGLEVLGEIAPEIVVETVSSVDEAMATIGETDVLVTLPPHLGSGARRLFAAAARLRWVQLVSTGSDNVREHLVGRDVMLTSARGLHGHQMSEAVLSAMLCLARDVPRLQRNQSLAKWERFPARLLHGKVAGIVGLGAIAETLAPILKALGMRVIGYSGSARPVDGIDEVRARDLLTASVGDVDYLVLLAPLTPDTAGLIDARVFAAMKRSSYLINLARGGIVDEPALLAALDGGEIAGAALDVFAAEPLPADSPWWWHDKVVVTPHVGGIHDGYARDVLALASDNLGRFLAGKPLRNLVDLSPESQQ